jgi:DNA-binding CsgD family transcriptional regulator
MTAVAQWPSAVSNLTSPARDLMPSTGGMVAPLSGPALRDEIVMLRGLETYQELLDQSCAAVVRACRLDRALFSQLDNRTWHPSASYSRARGPADRRFLAWLRSGPVLELDAGSVEHSAITTGTVIEEGGAGPTWLPPSVAGSLELGPHLIAPVFCEGRAIGLLHADRSGRPLCAADRDVLATFVEVLSLLLERAATRERSTPDRAAPGAPAYGHAVHLRPRSTDHLAELTARQVEVLAAMATGASNAEIAASLFVSTTTVKSHVRRILGTLHVPNRGGAIAHYLRHTMNGPTRVR